MRNKKVVLIDGASLHAMVRTWYFDRIGFKLLYNLLRDTIGGPGEFAFPPIVTMHPTTEGTVLAEVVQKIGFEAIFVGGDGEQRDDKELIARLRRMDSHDADTLIILSADQDFLPYVLEKKQAMPHLQVCWAGTRDAPPDENSPIGQVLEHAFIGQGITFFELNKFKNSLGFIPTARDDAFEEDVPHRKGVRFIIDVPNDGQDSDAVGLILMKALRTYHPKVSVRSVVLA